MNAFKGLGAKKCERKAKATPKQREVQRLAAKWEPSCLGCCTDRPPAALLLGAMADPREPWGWMDVRKYPASLRSARNKKNFQVASSDFTIE